MLSRIISICGNTYENCKNWALLSSKKCRNWLFSTVSSEISSLFSAHILIILLNIIAFFWITLEPMQVSNLVWYAPFTYQFAHAGAGHLFGNMLWLSMIGWAVEREIGWLRFVFVYLFAGVMSGLGFGLLEPQSLLVGASGSICGILGAYIITRKTFTQAFVYFLPFAFYLLNQLNSAINDWQSSTAFVGHICGAVAGIIACAIVRKK